MSGISKDIADLRREYSIKPLHRADLDANPFKQFDTWFEEALQAESMDPNAMSIATTATNGQPSIRTVLLKYFDEDGFVFYTNLGSRKAGEIEANNRVALLFYWHELHRQVKIIGKAERISAADNIRYFMRRPRDSQIGAWVSQQSSIISSRSILENKFAEMKQKFAHGDIPLPSFWGGYRVVPTSIEFWQGRENRLHDRFMFTPGESDWDIERLAP
ncbi:MAG: pyridoxamine 5'-phosphate oxidase [Gammaproteobacteria bacterium]|nr:MAG: pyridoxamine 5'-phosphate oxidase [Gammaproteobacteria bacterium]